MALRVRPAAHWQAHDSELKRMRTRGRPAIAKAFKAALQHFGDLMPRKRALQHARAGDWHGLKALVPWGHLREVLRGPFGEIIKLRHRAAYLGAERINEAFRARGRKVRFHKAGGIVLPFRKAPDDRFGFDLYEPKTAARIRAAQDEMIRELEAQVRNTIEQTIITGSRLGLSAEQMVDAIRENITLTERQSQAVMNYREALYNLDPAALERQLRNGQYDDALREAIANGEALSEAAINEMAQDYLNNYLDYRANTIAETESVRAVSAGLQDSYAQAIERGVMPADAVRQYWKVSLDELTCPICLSIPDRNPDGVGIGQAFDSIDGPMDAPPDPHPNCRCEVEIVTDLDKVPEAPFQEPEPPEPEPETPFGEATTPPSFAELPEEGAAEGFALPPEFGGTADVEEAAAMAEEVGQTPPFSIDTSEWEKVGGQMGSNPGGTYEDEQGNKWYVKQPKSEDHARIEVLANKLYEAAGVEVPRVELVMQDGNAAVASEVLPKVKTMEASTAAERAVITQQLRPGFAMDAWLGNRDVIGLTYDNVLWDGKTATRIDSGGSMYYRARGGRKEFGDKVVEFASMRDPGIAQSAAKVFGGMSKEDLVKSIDRVLAIPSSEIARLVDTFGPKDANERMQLRTILEKRRQDLKRLRDELAPPKPAFVEPTGALPPGYNFRWVPSDDGPAWGGVWPETVQERKIFDPARYQGMNWEWEVRSRNIAELENWYRAGQTSKFTEDEVRGMRTYTGSGYRSINKAMIDKRLRDGAGTSSSTVKAIDKAMAKASFPADAKAFRGFKRDAWRYVEEAIKADHKTLRDLAFVSSSMEYDTALNFAGTRDRVVEIYLPKGSRAVSVRPISNVQGEMEILINRGAKMQYMGVNPESKHHMFLLEP